MPLILQTFALFFIVWVQSQFLCYCEKWVQVVLLNIYFSTCLSSRNLWIITSNLADTGGFQIFSWLNICAIWAESYIIFVLQILQVMLIFEPLRVLMIKGWGLWLLLERCTVLLYFLEFWRHIFSEMFVIKKPVDYQQKSDWDNGSLIVSPKAILIPHVLGTNSRFSGKTYTKRQKDTYSL